MKVITLDAKLWNTAAEHGVSRDELTQVIETASREAADLLKNISPFCNVVISPTRAEWVIPETGTMGMTYSDEYVSLTFDPEAPYGVASLMRAMHTQVFHELTHSVSFGHDEWQPGVLFGVVTEGLATTFERDHGGGEAPLWGEYEDDATMRAWYLELKKLPESNEKDRRYFVEHSDGRKWIVYKTGVWMIDKLMADGASFDELLAASPTAIIERFDSYLK